MSDLSGIIDQVAQQVVKIQTLDGWGTGFVHYARDGGTRSIVTARHVVESAIQQKQPIRVCHGARVSIFDESRGAVFVQRTDADVDSALLAVVAPELPRPQVPVIEGPERVHITTGTEVGWLGYPALDSIDHKLCFFSGRVSMVDMDTHRYLIDGTGVNGCSGGPAFCTTPDGPRIIGAIIQYIPNVTDHGLLPGLSAVVDVSNYKALEDAFERMPRRKTRVSLTVKLDECPRCGAGLCEECNHQGESSVLACSQGCGPLLDLLDPQVVATFPGGPGRLNAVLHEAYKKVNA